VKKGGNKDVHLVVDFLKSGECHSHALLEKGVNCLVSRRSDDVCQRLAASMDGFLMLGYT
jgi:hypothetical protein